VSKHYKSAGFEIFPVSGKVLRQNEVVKIRPKTFQLLLLLIESHAKVVSKKDILEQVWDDVLVDEQVIFQSIKEIRKIFTGLDVIKTQPRKGYAWVTQVEFFDSEKAKPISSEETQSSQANSTHIKMGGNKPSPTKKIVLIAIIALLISVGILIVPNIQKEESQSDFASSTPPLQAVAGSVIILPIKYEVNDMDHRWVRYGAMDQLIQTLKSSDHYAIIQTEDVLDIMKRASMPLADHNRQDIENIFKVSGASLIADIKLTGNPGDYQLIYSFHTRHNIKRGVVIKPQINQALVEVASLVNLSLGQSDNKTTSISYHSSFANQMLATALELIQAEDYASAANFLTTTLATESENLIARRLLSQTLIFRGLLTKANQQLTFAIEQAKLLNDHKELARLRFWFAVSAMQNKQPDIAIQRLVEAKASAEQVKDWLYLGYIAEIMGKAYQSKKDYAKAKAHFLNAMENHQLIQCPYGQSKGLFNLSQLAFAQGDYKSALEQIEQSLAIINNRELSDLKAETLRWKQQLLKVQSSTNG